MKIIDKTYSDKFKNINTGDSFKYNTYTYIKCSNNVSGTGEAFNINTLSTERFPDNANIVPVNIAILITDKDSPICDIELKENIIEEDNDLPM